MGKHEIEKARQLGIPYATARNQLIKSIMFSMAQELGADICFQCGEKIIGLEELSIEHKQPWLHSENPKELFFSLENIAFSHLNCNTAARRVGLPKYGKRIQSPEGQAWCSEGKHHEDIHLFPANTKKWNGVHHSCQPCINRRKRERRGNT